ncbi:alpha/beta hydrolase [Sphingobacteriales bacterium UPWRP_1]|nr:alpha/beta hydrolase [Sphingobacteriales bacterium TSM_CSS]PSJ73970.1 alpha/beta hydrolase [Sphingobacteriales bacterium UPWRP_1]
MWLSAIALLIALYLAACIIAYFIQEWFIFHPEKLPADFQYQYEYPFEEVFLHPEPGAVINGLHFKLPRAKGVVFYFKGNSRSVKGWGKFARDFLGKDYNFFMIDYRGFGKSRGRRSEATLYHDCQVAYNYLKTLYPEEKIIVYGRSMGSGFATRIAAENNPQKLILDSPYYSFIETARRFLPFLPVAKIIKYHIRTDLWMPGVKCPVFILHGTKDRLIPFSSGKKLSLLSQNGVIIPIEDAGHNNLPRFAAYHDHLYAILNGVTRQYAYNSGIKASYD